MVMRRYRGRATGMGLVTGILALGFCWSLAWGNPAMLPKHPGYPIGKPVDPVNKQPLANDTGETNAVGDKALAAAAAYDDSRSVQHLDQTPSNDQRYLEKPGAGLLPKVQGPDIKINPPVKEATRMK